MARTKQTERTRKKAAKGDVHPDGTQRKWQQRKVTKKSLVQQEKAARRERDQANQDEIDVLFGRKPSSGKKRKNPPHLLANVMLDGNPLRPGDKKRNKRDKKRRNSNSNGGRKKKPPFQLKPIQNPKNCRVPWWTDHDRKEWLSQNQKILRSPSAGRRQSTRHYLFGHDKPHDAWLAQLDAELRSFASYVQVSPPEVEARTFVVNTLEAISRKNLDCVLPEDRDGVRVQVFGSFATQPVCAFCSDVDMALHGVVPPPEEEEEEEARAPVFAKVASAKKKNQNDKVQKWKDVLEQYDANQAVQDEAHADPDDEGAHAESDEENDKVQKWKDVLEQYDANQAAQDEAHADPDDEEAHAESDKEEPWKNTLDHFLEGANEAPDYRGRSDSCVSGASAMSGASSLVPDAAAKPIVDLSTDKEDEEDDDIKPAAKATKEVIDVDRFEDAEDDDDNDLKPAAKQAAKPTAAAKSSSDNFFVVDRVGAEVVDLNDDSDAEDEKKDDNENTSNKKSEKQEISGLPPGVAAAFAPRKRAMSVASSSDSEEDTADKLASLHKRKKPRASQFEDVERELPPQFEDAENDLICLSSDEEEEEDDDIHVSIVHQPAPPKISFGPQGAVRVKVVNALGDLGSILRKRKFTKKVEIIRGARVPIVKFDTKMGFEADVAMGGHNGTDTSQFAKSQVARFDSFATVVMALKIMLWQQGLDTPFIGGLGSYKLYVLVAYHLERHLELGGSDRPAEVFLSFMYRYGIHRNAGILQRSDKRSRTLLQLNTKVDCNGGYNADLSAVYLIRHCVDLFQQCFFKIGDQGIYTKPPRRGSSILVDLFDVGKLIEERTISMEKASLLEQFCKETKAANKAGAGKGKKKAPKGGGQGAAKKSKNKMPKGSGRRHSN